MNLWEREIRQWERDAAGTLRRASIDKRGYWLRRFARTAGTAGPYRTSTAAVVSWLAGIGPAPETRKSARSSLRTFYAWAVLTERTDIDPTARTLPIRVPPGVPHPADDRDIRLALMRAAPRVRLMIALGAYGGLRRAEIAGLSWLHIQEEQRGRVIRVIGKGGAARRVPVNSRLAVELDGGWTGGPVWLFPSPGGGHLTPGHVGVLIRRAGLTPHSLRHRALTRAYAADHDIEAVRRIAGHASISTTQRYVATDDDALWRAADGAS